MRFSLFYPVAVARHDQLGSGLLGLDPGLYATALAELKEQAICADTYGWTSLMLAEHHFEVEGYQVTPNPLLLNVFLAQHTTRLRHGQMGLALPNWNPLRLAEDIAMADHLTGGRLDVGLSRGYQNRSIATLAQHYHADAAGTGRTDAEARNRRLFEEWFEVMRRSWTRDLWSYEGEFIQVPPPGLPWPHPVTARLGGGVTDGVVTELATVPKPLQTPYPPLFTTLTQSTQTLDWAARVGSTIVTIATQPEQARGIFEAYASAAAGYGRTVGVGAYHPGGGVALSRALAVAATHEEAWEAARQGAVMTTDWLGEFGFFEAWRLPGQEGPVPRTLEQMVAAGALLVGTPDEVGEQLEKLRDETGVEYVIFNAAGGMTEHQRMLDMIQLFGEHVIPALSSVEPAEVSPNEPAAADPVSAAG
ncbi:LLM class flavin-dependent oxidoreductase [Frankia sp. CNm7]|uniref:LLM class flavin-dependent oxidoreductase n=1 Tax=Frankia nepalensis TaxID=1836974 RepID=A0A937RFC9_9ACTN|nr:LLM class flavin-dependent oxidoreductase [Frankia nepalensis]MBL7497984.1 LLM class flavin-dependent oxidoreductase [Frankia nepalensis]MBL7509065.1 LLM class flavin-dependent oxidoreductase [Frankia nepalensis]MBL7516832.1 LLM class flavin-dependent oxidoreductase [Frankia nepalensis]MBL7627829.1 LLM class flavin-dependent oxidoreductase [Frankia nepalensis]